MKHNFTHEVEPNLILRSTAAENAPEYERGLQFGDL
jgi:hypothetical protein